MKTVSALLFSNLDWGDGQVEALADALEFAHQEAGLSGLCRIELDGNKFGDRGAFALARLIRTGALSAGAFLSAKKNHIGDDGLLELRTVCKEHQLVLTTGSQSRVPAFFGLSKSGHLVADTFNTGDNRSLVKLLQGIFGSKHADLRSLLKMPQPSTTATHCYMIRHRTWTGYVIVDEPLLSHALRRETSSLCTRPRLTTPPYDLAAPAMTSS